MAGCCTGRQSGISRIMPCRGDARQGEYTHHETNTRACPGEEKSRGWTGIVQGAVPQDVGLDEVLDDSQEFIKGVMHG